MIDKIILSILSIVCYIAIVCIFSLISYNILDIETYDLMGLIFLIAICVALIFIGSLTWPSYNIIQLEANEVRWLISWIVICITLIIMLILMTTLTSYNMIDVLGGIGIIYMKNFHIDAWDRRLRRFARLGKKK